tara:strand:- start:2920 stop:3324 length:405 start_codon:yes stop_codon:yes gene_type:complete
MAAQKGSAVLMKIAVSGTQTTIGGLRSSSITLNDEMVDITNKDSSNARILLPNGGIQTVTISGSGVFTDSAAEVALRTAFGGSSLLACSFIIPDLGTYSGNFQITSLEYSGEYNGEATYSVTAESGGAVSFAAA